MPSSRLMYDGPERRADPGRISSPGNSPYREATIRIVSSVRALRRLIANQHVERGRGAAALGRGVGDGRKSS